MARTKVKLSLIPNESARKRTFYKRKKGILKKMGELSTLCGIMACAIIYAPYELQPDVWPSPIDVLRGLNMFKMMPEFDQCRKMLSHEEYLRQRITKLKDQSKKVQKENRRKEIMMLMSECLVGKDLNDLSMLDLSDLTDVIDEKLGAIDRRIEALLKQTPPEIGTSSSIAGEPSKEHTVASQVAVNALQGQPWFMDGMNLNEPVPVFGNEVLEPYVDNRAWTTPLFL